METIIDRLFRGLGWFVLVGGSGLMLSWAWWLILRSSEGVGQ